jgi:phosphopantothenoylcysteine synthetase/decarboxylase
LRSRITVYGLVAVLAVGAIGVGVASGAKKKVKSKTTISFQSTDYGSSFSGKVKTKGQAKKKIKKKCKKGRNVVVIRKSPNKQKLGQVKSKKKGVWNFNVGGVAEPGNYFAKVKKKVKKKGDNKIVCKKGKSPTISVP